MWRIDKENYEEEERRVKERIDKVNRDNKLFLMMQIQEKNKKENKQMPL